MISLEFIFRTIIAPVIDIGVKTINVKALEIEIIDRQGKKINYNKKAFNDILMKSGLEDKIPKKK